jgi:hypothetical protein
VLYPLERAVHTVPALSPECVAAFEQVPPWSDPFPPSPPQPLPRLCSADFPSAFIVGSELSTARYALPILRSQRLMGSPGPPGQSESVDVHDIVTVFAVYLIPLGVRRQS